MKRIACLALLTFFSTAVPAFEWNFSPYVGLEASLRPVNLGPHFGKPLYRRTLNQGSVFVGMNFYEFLGFEAGYESTFEKTHQRQLSPGAFLPGSMVPVSQTQIYNVKLSMDSFNLGIKLRTSLFSPCNHQTYGFVLLGGSYMKLKAKQDLVAINAGIPTETQRNTLFRSFKKERLVPYGVFGLEQDIVCHLTARVFVNWKETSKFKVRSEQSTSNLTELRLKDSLGYGLGFIFSF